MARLVVVSIVLTGIALERTAFFVNEPVPAFIERLRVGTVFMLRASAPEGSAVSARNRPAGWNFRAPMGPAANVTSETDGHWPPDVAAAWNCLWDKYTLRPMRSGCRLVSEPSPKPEAPFAGRVPEATRPTRPTGQRVVPFHGCAQPIIGNTLWPAVQSQPTGRWIPRCVKAAHHR